jgi:plasmid rolling circle replication initiator protein Rep
MNNLSEKVSLEYNHAGGKCKWEEEEDADLDRRRQRKRRSVTQNKRERLHHKGNSWLNRVSRAPGVQDLNRTSSGTKEGRMKYASGLMARNTLEG